MLLFHQWVKTVSKYEAVIYGEEEGYYVHVTRSFFNKYISSWQRIASKMYPMEGQWMIETGKNVPVPMLEMNKIIKTLTIIHDEITHNLEERICGCYFDDVESIIGAIMTKEYHDMEENDYCEKLLKLY